jgi:hypothetical protein
MPSINLFPGHFRFDFSRAQPYSNDMIQQRLTLLPFVCELKTGFAKNRLNPHEKYNSDLFANSSVKPGALFITKCMTLILCSLLNNPNNIKLKRIHTLTG